MRKKFNFGMVALVLLANSIFSATNAKELPSFDSIKQFVEERLAGRENNEDIDMVPMTEVKRSDLCDLCAHVNLPTNKTCDTEWAPNYVTPEGKTGCICLKEYVCCPEPGHCPELDEEACTKKGFVHGLHFLEKGKDCCQCATTTCKPCPKPDLEEKLNCVPVCETYVERHHKHAVTGCWESACVKKPAPTPAPANCDDRCQEEVTRKDNCTHPYLACEAKTAPLNCGPDEPDQRPCHEKPTKAFLSTFYYEGNKCEPCYTWSQPPSPHPPHVPVTCDSRCQKLVTKVDECGFTSDECEALVVPDSCKPKKPDPVECHEKPEQQFVKQYYYGGSKCDTCWKFSMPKIPCPELTNTCHMHDGRTGICWDKGVGLTPDKCCHETKCFNKNEDCFQKFPKSESCSEGFQKFSGVSLCGLARDVCVECEKDWTLLEKDCPSSCYDKVTYKDRAGCQAQRCVTKACPAMTIPKCDNGKLVINKEACGCEQNGCDFNECASKPCQNGATCVAKLNSYECACETGYSGTLCENSLNTVTEDGETWDLIQRRNNVGRNDGFDKNWTQYKNGFGNPDAYWLGLEKMYQLTRTGNWQLLLMAKHIGGSYAERWGKLVYDNFKIGNEASGYKLSFGTRLKKVNTGENGHHLLDYHKGMKFSTKDVNNSGSCVSSYGGGWWYRTCWVITLNGHGGGWNDGGSDRSSSQTLMAMRRTS